MTTAVMNRIDVEYEQPLDTEEGSVCSTKHAWARVPPEPTARPLNPTRPPPQAPPTNEEGVSA